MKNILKLASLLLFSIISIASYSQTPTLSLEGRAGLNFSKPDAGEYNTDSRTGYRFEGIIRLTMANNVFIQSGLGFSQKNGKYSTEGIGDTDGNGYIDYARIEEKGSTRYFHLPVMFGYKYKITSDFSVNAALGFYFGFGAGGKYESKAGLLSSRIQYTPENLESIRIDDLIEKLYYENEYDTFGNEGVYKRGDVGARFEIGAEYKRILLNAGYEHGFTDISKSKVGVHNRNFFISLGVRIL